MEGELRSLRGETVALMAQCFSSSFRNYTLHARNYSWSIHEAHWSAQNVQKCTSIWTSTTSSAALMALR
jgi:hypothetical protein